MKDVGSVHALIVKKVDFVVDITLTWLFHFLKVQDNFSVE